MTPSRDVEVERGGEAHNSDLECVLELAVVRAEVVRDRKLSLVDLLEEVGTRVWQFDGKSIIDFKGSYEELSGAPV